MYYVSLYFYIGNILCFGLVVWCNNSYLESNLVPSRLLYLFRQKLLFVNYLLPWPKLGFYVIRIRSY